MTFSQKMGLIEDLWNHLSRDKVGFTPPEWHGEVLKSRQERIDSGDIG
ncbi:MAG: addiction module protein, partial [Spartobacteria bacterium]